MRTHMRTGVYISDITDRRNYRAVKPTDKLVELTVYRYCGLQNCSSSFIANNVPEIYCRWLSS